MKLLLKFNLIFVVTFGCALAVGWLVFSSFSREHARNEVLREANLLLQTSASIRNYTSTQIDPLIRSLAAASRTFHPQTIPFYAATENFATLHASNPEYSYKEATLNPTNPRDKATAWEEDIIRLFRDDPKRQDFDRVRNGASGPLLVLARPIVVKAECLQCHSTPEAAPASIIRQYGRTNGFGWKLQEVVGAQILSVPMTVSNQMADEMVRSFLIALVIVAAVTLIVLNLALATFVIQPVSRLAQAADQISRGQTDLPELPVRGHDEISVLVAAFNRMHRSLSIAIKMLEKDGGKRIEHP